MLHRNFYEALQTWRIEYPQVVSLTNYIFSVCVGSARARNLRLLFRPVALLGAAALGLYLALFSALDQWFRHVPDCWLFVHNTIDLHEPHRPLYRGWEPFTRFCVRFFTWLGDGPVFYIVLKGMCVGWVALFLNFLPAVTFLGPLVQVLIMAYFDFDYSSSALTPPKSFGWMLFKSSFSPRALRDQFNIFMRRSRYFDTAPARLASGFLVLAMGTPSPRGGTLLMDAVSRFGSPLLSQLFTVFMAVFFCPALEEHAKRANPVWGVAFVAQEAYNRRAPLMVTMVLVWYHAFLAMLPFGLAVVMHTAWNASAMFAAFNMGAAVVGAPASLEGLVTLLPMVSSLMDGSLVEIPWSSVRALVGAGGFGVWFCQLLVLLNGFRLADTWAAVVNCLSQFLLGCEGIRDVVMRAWDQLFEMVSGWGSAEGPALSPLAWAASAFGAAQKAMSSKLWYKVKSLVAYLSVGGFLAQVGARFSPEWLQRLCGLMGSAVGDYAGLAKDVVGIVLEIARGGVAYFQGVPYDWWASDGYVDIPMRSAELVADYGRRATLAESESGRPAVHIYISDIERMLARIEMTLRLNPGNPKNSGLQTCFRDLTGVMSAARAVVEGASWSRAPFVVGITGPTEQGKSSFLAAVFRAAAMELGLKVQDENGAVNIMENVYPLQDDKFDDAFSCQQMALADDVGSVSDQESIVASAKKLLKILNNAPSRANMADVNSKGKMVHRFELVGITSNNPLYVAAVCADPGAFLRRIHLQIDLQPKLEYSRSTVGPTGSRQIDPERVPEGEESLWDIDLRVGQPCPEYPGFEFVSLKRTDNLATALGILIERFRAHRKRQDAIIRTLSTPISEVCARGVSVRSHGLKAQPCGPGCLVGRQPPVEAAPVEALPESADLSLVAPRAVPEPVTWTAWSSTVVWAMLLPLALALATWWFAALLLCVGAALLLSARFRIGVRRLWSIVGGVRTGDFGAREAAALVWIVWADSGAFGAAWYLACGSHFTRKQGGRLLFGFVAALVVSIGLAAQFLSRPHRAKPEGAVESQAFDASGMRASVWSRPPPMAFDAAAARVAPVGMASAPGFMARRLFTATITSSLGTGMSMWFCLGGDMFLTVRHTLPPSGRFSVALCNSAAPAAFTQCLSHEVEPDMMRDVGDDLVVVRVVGGPACGSALQCFFQARELVPRGGPVQRYHRDIETREFASVDVGLQEERDMVYVTARGTHKNLMGVVSTVGWPGLCGAIYAQVTGSVVRIIGVHVASSVDRSCGIFSRVCLADLRPAMDSLVKYKALSVPAVPTMEATPDGLDAWLDEGLVTRLQPHYKSCLHGASELAGVYLGSGEARATMTKSRVQRTIIGPVFQAMADELGCDYAAPALGPAVCKDGVWRHPDIEFVRGFGASAAVRLPEYARDFAELDALVGDEWLRRPRRPLDDQGMVNGVGARNLEALTMSTGAGYPHYGVKRALFTLVERGGTVQHELGDELRAELDEAEDRARRGLRLCLPFALASKDEVLAASKVDVCATRKIAGGAMVLTLILRRYALPVLVDVLMGLPEVSVGMDAAGLDGSDWCERMLNAPGDGLFRAIDGDIKKFDRCWTQHSLWKVVLYAYHVAEVKGFCAEDLRVLWAGLFELVQPVILFRGDVFQMMNYHPTGQALTTICNCLQVMFVYLYAVRKAKDHGLVPPSAGLRDVCVLSVYGDDNCASTCHDAFTFEFLRDAFADCGYTLTPGDKDKATSGGPLTELTFLKRTPRWSQELGRWVLALSPKSIARACTWKVASSAVSAEEQEAAVLVACAREAYLWGEPFYAEFVGLIDKCPLAVRAGVKLPTVDALKRALNAGVATSW